MAATKEHILYMQMELSDSYLMSTLAATDCYCTHPSMPQCQSLDTRVTVLLLSHFTLRQIHSYKGCCHFGSFPMIRRMDCLWYHFEFDFWFSKDHKKICEIVSKHNQQMYIAQHYVFRLSFSQNIRSFFLNRFKLLKFYILMHQNNLNEVLLWQGHFRKSFKWK